MPNIQITVDGITFPNPFVIASGPPGTNKGVISKAFKEGWGGVIAKTVSRSFFDLRPGEGAVVEVEGEKVAAYLHDDGTTYLLSARCQHMGCLVDWNSRARTWDCPCHGPATSTTGRSSPGRPPSRCHPSRSETGVPTVMPEG